MRRYSYFLLIIAQFLQVGALVVRPSSYRWIFFPIIAGLNLCYYFVTTNENHRAVAALSIGVASDYILLTDVQREFRRVGQREPISNASFWSRLKWGLQLFVGFRGVGWAHEPTSVLPPHPNLTRVQYIVSRLGWLATNLLLKDVCGILIRANPYFARNAPSLSEQPLAWRFGNVFLYAVSTTVNITIPHTCYAIFAVGSGLSQPHTWPHIMGRWDEAYTIRKFWGRTWHQGLRRMFSAHGKFLAHRVFKFTPGTNLSSYAQLYTAFLISGLVHIPPSDTGALQFFILQAIAITFEDAVIALAARVGLKYSSYSSLFRRLGYIWVYCWFVYSLTPWVNFQVSSGLFEHGGMKLSLVLGLYFYVFLNIK